MRMHPGCKRDSTIAWLHQLETCWEKKTSRDVHKEAMCCFEQPFKERSFKKAVLWLIIFHFTDSSKTKTCWGTAGESMNEFIRDVL